MPKKKKIIKKQPFRFGIMEGSNAIEYQSPPEVPAGVSKVSVTRELKHIQSILSSQDLTSLPHQNRPIALAHQFCDAVASQTTQWMVAESKSVACESGCDACCYYTDMDATALEFEEVLNYVRTQQPDDIRRQLLKQVRDEPEYTKQGFKPCPFLDRRNGQCGIYPVRPVGCRTLLATRRCQLNQEEDCGLEDCLEKVEKAWKHQEMPPGKVFFLLEQQRLGKSQVALSGAYPNCLVKFKQLENELLEKLFASQ